MLAGSMLTGVLAFCSGMGMGLLLATAGGGTLILSIIVLHYLLGITHTALFGTAAAVTTVNALFLFRLRREAFYDALRPALWFGLPGLLGMTISRMIPHDVTTKWRLALLGFLMIVNTMLSFILPKITRQSRGLHRKRLVMAGCGIGILVGYFGGTGGFLALPSMLITGLPQSIAVSSSILTVAGFSLTAAMRDIVRADVNWKVVLLYVLGVKSGLLTALRVLRLKPSKTFHWMAMALILLGGIFLLQQNWFSLYTPCLALYDGIKGGLWNEFAT